jgi:hypothetical protein
MTVIVEGVSVKNPTQVWMELQNTRRNVLTKRNRWNDSGWISGDLGSGSLFTMCLANAVRYVGLGVNGRPAAFSRSTAQMTVAEELIVKAIGKLNGHPVEDIPAWNDNNQRRFSEVIAVIDQAIEWIKPHAQTYAITYATDIMTPEELAEQDKQVIAIQNQMWRERYMGSGYRQDKKGRIRDALGRFARLPAQTVAQTREVNQFKLWIDDFDRRGWDKFWDELFECDEGDEDCQKAKALIG